ncbi:helix-turn-helix domain-containing protein [Streptomyces sp. NPDC059906]|uniref:helix-turn-helix domain-containing protein n=1 Tax=Streptomyces sp. NPDC059906 TaxID=3346997 RepID=UPI00365CAABE
MPPQATTPARAHTAPALNLVPVDEAATLLGRSPRTVRRLAAAGTIPAHRIGARTWAIDRASLDTYRHGETAA